MNLKNGLSRISRENYDRSKEYELYFKTELQSKPFSETHFLSEQAKYPNAFKDLMNKQEKFYRVSLENFKDQGGIIFIISLMK